jgi:uncharacterized protein (UPF0335 family)
LSEPGGNAAQDQLRLFVERIERLDGGEEGDRDDIRDVKAEAKANGYDPRTLMAVIRIRAMDKNTYQEQQALLETYLAAFGIGDDE